MKLPALADLLQYQNPEVLKLYNQNYPQNTLTAEAAFTEVLKYLWLSKKHSIELEKNQDNPSFPASCFMPRSMREIDEMWHEFILFTEDYMAFCDHFFGEYMHHLPNIFDTLQFSREDAENEVEKLLPYIYDNLGEETLKTWFHAYLD